MMPLDRHCVHFVPQTLLLEGEVPVLDVLGIAIGHLYHVLKEAGVVSAPRSWDRIFEIPWVRRRYKAFQEEGLFG